jgi:predicted metal-dependent hydrolase
MSTKRIDLPGLGAVTIYKRKGTRSIRLSVSLAGEVRISMPHWLPYDAGAKFALSKAGWIQAQMQEQASKPLAHTQAIGKSHHLYFRRDIAATRVTSRITDTMIRITHPLDTEITDHEVQKVADSACIRALRQQSTNLLPQRLKALANTHNFSYNDTAIKQLRGRWGSCDAEQNIVLNLFLIQLPWQLIDYVLLHELTHTKVLHHGPEFWQEFERHLPQARALRKEIKLYSPTVISA